MSNPYKVGQPVTGDRFYGRAELLHEVLESEKGCYCTIASRRFGKTSFLRQLEQLTIDEPAPYLALYWDMSGAQTEGDLHTGLLFGIQEDEVRFDRAGVSVETALDVPLERLLLHLCIAAQRQRKKLLLLCDECEWLIPTGHSDPALLSRLRGIMQRRGVRTVLAGSRRLAELNSIKFDGSSFLHGFEPITFVPCLSETDARSLIQQKGGGLNLPPELVSAILDRTNCHPYLIQAVCYYLWGKTPDGASLEKACEVTFTEFGDFAFEDDFRYLSPAERIVLLKVLHDEDVTGEPETRRLSEAGYLKATDGQWRLANWFFARWLRAKSSTLDAIESRVSDPAAKKLHGDFDVFLCHNSADKPAVKAIAEKLKERGIVPWLDEWELRPGLPWQRLLEQQIGQIKSAAVFVGSGGIGPWQQEELDALLRQFVTRGCPVIPVVLPDAPATPDIPSFLGNRTWVDFRRLESDPLARLAWGITGEP